MQIQHISAIFFSPMHTTKLVVTHIAEALACFWPQAKQTIHDFTLPQGREKVVEAYSGELIVVGLPVYAGRLPNLLLPYLQQWKGYGALVVPIVVYGNRSYGNSLIELHDILKNNGFIPIAAAAFVGQHSFSNQLATGRPNLEDLNEAKRLASHIHQKITLSKGSCIPPLSIPGKGAPDYGGYYKPLGIDGQPTQFLKAKPETADNCIHCMKCVSVCPMEAIDSQNPSHIPGICIKCNSCIYHCPVKAKKFHDSAYLSHVQYLEKYFKDQHPAVEWF